MALEVFNSLVNIQVSSGSSTWFWKDRWIGGRSVEDIAPLVLAKVMLNVWESRTVQQGLIDHRWVVDISPLNLPWEEGQYNAHWCAIMNVHRDTSLPDKFSWPWNANGCYSASLVYWLLCQGRERFPAAHCIWKCWAPLKCKIFVWLALQHRLWTSDKRARHGL